ncbi:MAG TPA: hypothetical protein P5081_24950 [Phycisphaerae bacterium]|nr:hypothetical protein [Phycisphaerae bacterium]HRW56135.1 hypothetical protein [Phycisphaerae bacterium]
MLRCIRYSFLSCAIICAIAPLASANPFTVDSWLLSVSIQSESTTTAGSATVSNPFLTTHSRMLGDDWVSADYDFSWAQQGHFLIDTSLAATATPADLTVTSVSGRIKITPTEDLVVRYQTVFDVTLPADSMTAYFEFRVLDPINGGQANYATVSADTTFHTGFSHLHDDGEFLLPANRTWDFVYLFDLAPRPSSAGQQAVGNGFLRFDIIPEPATLALLAPFAALVPPRRRRS